MPNGQCLAEKTPWNYLDSALSRRHISHATGAQLSASDLAEWEGLLEDVPLSSRPNWKEDPVFLDAQTYFAEHGSFEALRAKKKKDGSVAAEQARLLRDLRIVRKALLRDQRDQKGHLLRRRLSSETQHKWEDAFAGAWSWGKDRQKELYCPGDCVQGERFEWPRTPYCCQSHACYLCGTDFPCKADLVTHWRDEHLRLPYEVMENFGKDRVEKKIRKLLFGRKEGRKGGHTE